MLYQDLRELKSLFEIDPEDTSEDKNLLIYNTWIADIIEEITARKFFYGNFTEIYKGSGTQKLLLKVRPVYVNPSPPVIFLDQQANFGSTSGAFSSATQLVYGTDFCLDLDQGVSASRSGILYRIGDLWQKVPTRQVGYLTPFVGPDLGSLQITYWAGFTLDQLPGQVRMAAALLAAGIRYLFPLGLTVTAENYEDRAIAMTPSQRDYLLSLARPRLMTVKNWYF